MRGAWYCRSIPHLNMFVLLSRADERPETMPLDLSLVSGVQEALAPPPEIDALVVATCTKVSAVMTCFDLI